MEIIATRAMMTSNGIIHQKHRRDRDQINMSELAIQAIGFVGVAFFIASYQIKSNKALFLCQMIGCGIFCVQFFIMGAYTGAVSLIINIIRNLLLVKRKEWKWVDRKSTMLVILALLTAMTIYTWDGIISLLPFIMVAVTTVGYWTNNAQKIRLSQFIGSPCVLLYDVLIRSWGGVLNETITLLSIIISVIRFGWKNMGSPDADF